MGPMQMPGAGFALAIVGYLVWLCQIRAHKDRVICRSLALGGSCLGMQNNNLPNADSTDRWDVEKEAGLGILCGRMTSNCLGCKMKQSKNKANKIIFGFRRIPINMDSQNNQPKIGGHNGGHWRWGLTGGEHAGCVIPLLWRC
jgi:hypothetical protein